MNERFEAALANYIRLLQERHEARMAAHYPNVTPSAYYAKPARRRFAKVVAYNGAQTTVHTFVEIATGDIYKAAGWSAHAPHVRGNIYGPEPLAGTTDHGGAYLR